MTPERKEYLDTQVVLTLINDGDLYRSIYDHVSAGNIDAFRTITCRYLNRIDTSRALLATERAYVYVTCWRYYGGTDDQAAKCSVDIGDKIRSALIEFPASKPVSSTPSPQEEIIMTQQVPFQTKHLVYGTDVSNMTEQQLIEAIKQVEGEIAQLGTVKTESKEITAKKAELESMLADIVKVLDAR